VGELLLATKNVRVRFTDIGAPQKYSTTSAQAIETFLNYLTELATLLDTCSRLAYQ
jgi:hypothetical protein